MISARFSFHSDSQRSSASNIQANFVLGISNIASPFHAASGTLEFYTL